jgi:nucleoside-diphosphate-sugar epimerase
LQRLLIIGCGNIAFRTLPHLNKHYRLFALVRSSEQHALLRSCGVTPILGDLDQPKSLVRLAGLANLIIHLAPPPNSGNTDQRTFNLLRALSKGCTLPHRFIYISTTGVYGNCDGERVFETRKLTPQTDRAKRRYDAEMKLRDWGIRKRVNVSILRVPGIYAEDRLPVERLKKQTPVLREQDDVYTNHIHAEDLARAILCALRYGQPCRTYNINDDSALKMGDYFDLVADHLKLPRPPRIPRAEAEKVFTENLLSFMQESRRLINFRMKKELRLRLFFSDPSSGLITLEKKPNCPQ